MGFEHVNDNDYMSSYQREFLNREDIRDHINTSVTDYNFADCYKLFLIYGIGGIGKTELLKKVKNTYTHSNQIIFISFSDSKDALRKLLDIRNHFVYAPQFDYLFLQYWENTKSEKLNEAYLSVLNKQFSFFEEKYSLISNIIGDCKPSIAYASDILKVGKSIWDYVQKKRWSDKFKGLLEDIAIQPEKILRLLHLVLSEDICAAENTGAAKPIFIFDNYKPEMLDDNVEWVREFVNSFNYGLFIISSREKLNWINESSDLVEEIKLPVIPNHYAKEYMLKLKIDPKSIDLIIKKTGSIPLYLDMAIALYFSSKDENFNILIKDTHSLIKAFLNHLSKEEREIVEILAVIENFNQTIYDNMLQINYLNNVFLSYDDFSQKSIMVDNSDGKTYKINEVIAHNMEVLMPPHIKQAFVSQYIKIINTRCIYELLPHEIMPYAVSSFMMAAKYFDENTLKKENVDYLFDMILFLMDTAWIKDFYEQVKHLDIEGILCELLKFIQGCVIRQTDIQLGLQILETISLDKFGDTKHRNTIICEMNYLKSIIGQYEEAEKKFNTFYHSLCPINRSERFYVKGSIYYADMLMMRGRFKKALMIFKDLESNPYLESNAEISKSIYLEVLKQEGHCYRFNMKLDTALKCYRSNTFQGYEPIRIKAYRLTTECETLCYFHPEEMKHNIKEALEINAKIQNNNSRAKIYYAMAIAELHNKSFKKAMKYIDKSFLINNQTHYEAGNLFTLLALAYTEYAQNGKVSTKTKERFFYVYNKVDKIYGYLLLPIYLISGEDDKVQNLKNEFEWLDYTYTVEQYNKFLSIIRE